MPDQIILDGMNVGNYQVKYPASGILSDVGAAGGVATLDANGKIPTSQIPSGGGGNGSIFANAISLDQIGSSQDTQGRHYSHYGFALGGVEDGYTPSEGDIVIIRANSDLITLSNETYENVKLSLWFNSSERDPNMYYTGPILQFGEVAYQIYNGTIFFGEVAASKVILHQGDTLQLRYRRTMSNNVVTDTGFDIIGKWVDRSGGGSGTTNYNDLTNKPQIGGITLSGNKTLNDLGIHNIPSGGSTNQVLAKNSGTNYDLKWVTVSGGGSSSGTYSGLEGKNVVFFGDSISYGEGNNGHSYIDIIDEMGICASVVKEAHTSSCVGPYNVYSDANGYDLISMIQLRATDIANADVVFCAYCGNDSDSLAHNLIQLGYPEESSTANTICGYTRRAIENIRAINPLVRIVWLFARMSNFTFLRDSTSTSYVSADYLIPTVKAMSEVCSDNNVTYGSQYDGLYLDKQHGHILNDIAGHPTELGHTLIAETVLHEYPFSVRPYEPVKHVTLNNDGTYNSTFAVLLLHAQHDIDIFVHYQGLVFRQKAYSSSGLLFESEGMASSSASTRYLLSITSSGASLYTTSSALTSVPWGGGGGDGVIYDGSVTIRTDAGGVNYCTINTSEPISADEIWTVVWNGTTYTLQSKYVTTLGPSDLNAYCIGNVDIEDGGDDGSGVPFYAYKYQSDVMAFGTTDPTGTITLRVVKGSSGSSDYTTYYDGNVTVVAASPSYFLINNYTYPFGANETYRITWDTGGTQYTCTTRQAGEGQAFDGYGIGNAGLAGGTDTGEPFLMYRDSATRLVSVTNHAAGTVHVKIEKYVGSSGT